MSGADVGLAVSVFLACTVEAVEALTIVLAVGTTRSWSSALGGVGAAALTLTAVVAALGPALTSLPIDVLRVGVGGLLLVFGLQWLRKAVLRAAGVKAKHDEQETFREETAAARAAGARHPGFDGYAFTVSFKGVLLEGLEVAFIVLTFGANQNRVPEAAAAAGLAVLVVAAAGVAARAPLARVPENTMKFAVGVMLRLVWDVLGRRGRGREVAGRRRGAPGDRPGRADGGVRGGVGPAPWSESGCHSGDARRTPRPGDGERMKRLQSGAVGVWEFVVGDDWRTALGVVLALALTAALAETAVAAWWVMPLAVLVLLALSIRRAARGASNRG